METWKKYSNSLITETSQLLKIITTEILEVGKFKVQSIFYFNFFFNMKTTNMTCSLQVTTTRRKRKDTCWVHRELNYIHK